MRQVVSLPLGTHCSRWSVPIAEVDNDLGDLAFLLVFPFHPFDDTFDNEAVWYYTWFHEEYPKRPDDKRSIVKVARIHFAT